MSSPTERLALTHYDGGDSPKWVGDDIPSYNSDMLKIDEWAAKIDPVAGDNDTRPNPTTIGASDIINKGVSETFARADHRHGILMGIDNDVKQLRVVTSNANLKGTSVNLARADHGHHVAVAAPSGSLSPTGSNAEGSATTFARSDHSHALTNVCPNNDARLDKAVNTYTALMTGANASVSTHTHNQYSEIGHGHRYDELEGLPGLSPYFIKQMDTKIVSKALSQAGKGIWTWYIEPVDYFSVGNVNENDILEIQAMLRTSSPSTSVGVSITYGAGTPANGPLRMFTSAYGGQSASVAAKYKFTQDYSDVRVWLGFYTDSDTAIVRIGGESVPNSYNLVERYTTFNYTLYGAGI